ncbi:MAG: type II toxin-antitoxin system Phd/YefM family antitoxin [Gammaproteobacteria bacterium]
MKKRTTHLTRTFVMSILDVYITEKERPLKTMRWGIAEAKQKFSDVVRKAGQEPQLIFNRDRLVAAVVDPETFEAFQTCREQEQSRSIAAAFDELRKLVAEEGYKLEAPPRRNRKNTFTGVLDSVSR